MYKRQAEAWLPEERITPALAYAAYTSGIAAQAQTEDRGSLQPGMIADAVWLSANPLDTPATKAPSIEVLGTWVAGDRSYACLLYTSRCV